MQRCNEKKELPINQLIQFRSLKGNQQKERLEHKERQKRATTHNRLDMLNVLRYLLFQCASQKKNLFTKQNTLKMDEKKTQGINTKTYIDRSYYGFAICSDGIFVTFPCRLIVVCARACEISVCVCATICTCFRNNIHSTCYTFRFIIVSS